jgi:hypothetical protein
LLQQPLGPGYQTHGGWLGLPFFTQFARDLPQKEPNEALPPPPVSEDIHEVTQMPVRQIRRGPWVVTLSGFTRPEAPKNRWELDYQAHVSIFHERAGLIVGGGGGKGKRRSHCSAAGASRSAGCPVLRRVERPRRLAHPQSVCDWSIRSSRRQWMRRFSAQTFN